MPTNNRRSFLDRLRRVTPSAPHPSQAAEERLELPSREQQDSGATASAPSLRQRMEDAYLVGYDERIEIALSYANGDAEKRTKIGSEVLQAKVITYEELDALTRTLHEELPDMEHFFSHGPAELPLTPKAEATLERAAHLAGRWDGLDPVINNQLSSIEHEVTTFTNAPSVIEAGDSRDAWFQYTYSEVQAAQQALPQIDRDLTERLARATTARTTTAAETTAHAVERPQHSSYPQPIGNALRTAAHTSPSSTQVTRSTVAAPQQHNGINR